MKCTEVYNSYSLAELYQYKRSVKQIIESFDGSKEYVERMIYYKNQLKVLNEAIDKQLKGIES